VNSGNTKSGPTSTSPGLTTAKAHGFQVTTPTGVETGFVGSRDLGYTVLRILRSAPCLSVPGNRDARRLNRDRRGGRAGIGALLKKQKQSNLVRESLCGSDPSSFCPVGDGDVLGTLVKATQIVFYQIAPVNGLSPVCKAML
jgi:hypothetical protein